MGSGDEHLFVQTLELSQDFEKNFQAAQLFYLTGDKAYAFVHTGGGEPLRYARYLTLSPLQDTGGLLPSDKILKISSHVLYKKGDLEESST